MTQMRPRITVTISNHQLIMSVKNATRRLKKIDVMTPDVVQALDASKVSNNQAAVILAAAAKALGVNVDNTNINRSTILQKRSQNRIEEASKQVQKFSTDEVLTLHWDGKIVPALTGREDVERVDRQAIVVTGITTNQLLGAPALKHATGVAIARAVADHVIMWDLVDKV